MNLAGQGQRVIRTADGYAMAALLVGLSIMSVLMSVALPVWSQMVKREKEEELIWRGQQYARAVGLFQRKYANTFPPTLDVLVEQKFLRKKYKDPITNDDFQLIPAGGGTPTPGQIAPAPGAPATGQSQTQTPSPFSSLARGPQGGVAGGPTANVVGAGTLNLGIAGVVSKSKDSSIKIYNGRQKYNEWAFVYMQTAQRVGPGGMFPGATGAPGQPGRGGPFAPSGPGGMGMPPGRGGPGGRGGFEPMMPGSGGRPPVPPFGQPGQPPFGQPQSPFGVPGQPQRPPSRPPG